MNTWTHICTHTHVHTRTHTHTHNKLILLYKFGIKYFPHPVGQSGQQRQSREQLTRKALFVLLQKVLRSKVIFMQWGTTFFFCQESDQDRNQIPIKLSVDQSDSKYRKTPLISTYIFSGLATEPVLIFGAVLTFGGYDKTEWKILQGRSLFNPVLSAHNTLLCMFQRLCTYYQDTGVLIFGGYVLSGHCTDSKFQQKLKGYLFSEGYLFTGFYGIESGNNNGAYLFISNNSESYFHDMHTPMRHRSLLYKIWTHHYLQFASRVAKASHDASSISPSGSTSLTPLSYSKAILSNDRGNSLNWNLHNAKISLPYSR